LLTYFLDYIDKKVAEYEAQLDESDAEDKAMLKEKIQLKLNRRKKYEELNKALKDSGESQISLTYIFRSMPTQFRAILN